MEIPAEFVLANPTLCGEAIVEAWKDVQSWSDWFCEHRGYISGNRETPTPCAADEWWAKSLFTRLRELGYRRSDRRDALFSGLVHFCRCSVAQIRTEPERKGIQAILNELDGVGAAQPDHSADVAQMAPDAKCDECGSEFSLASRALCECGIGNTHVHCPKCSVYVSIEFGRQRYRAAHPPAEPANPTETPAPDEVEGLAMKLKERFALAASTNDGWRYVAAAVLRLVREARYGELQRAMAHVSMNNEQAEWFVNRINKLKGGESE